MDTASATAKSWPELAAALVAALNWQQVIVEAPDDRYARFVTDWVVVPGE